MTSTSDPQARRLAGRILLWQAVVTLVLAGVITLAADAAAGGYTLVGGAIGWVANFYMSVAALRPARAAGAALARLLLGQFVKVLLTIAMFIAVAQRKNVVWPALMLGYIATMVVFWVVPVVDGPRQPPRSLPRETDEKQGTDV